MAKKAYVDSKELEEWWEGWIVTKDEYCWIKMADLIYKICEGVATRFNPKGDEHIEHVHDAVSQTLEKIALGKLRFTRGRAPVFNLITTTVFRILFSKMNRQKKQREHEKKYAYHFIQKHEPELLKQFEHLHQTKQLVVN